MKRIKESKDATESGIGGREMIEVAMRSAAGERDYGSAGGKTSEIEHTREKVLIMAYRPNELGVTRTLAKIARAVEPRPTRFVGKVIKLREMLNHTARPL